MKYYMICSDAESIIAIHKVQDSALHCFQSIISKGDFECFLYLRQIETDGNGLAIKEITMLTYSKNLPTIRQADPIIRQAE